MLKIIFAVAIVSGCGIQIKDKNEKKDENYYYQFDEGGCSTGRHVFKTVNELCVSLRDEGANKSCAPAARESLYKSYNCKN